MGKLLKELLNIIKMNRSKIILFILFTLLVISVLISAQFIYQNGIDSGTITTDYKSKYIIFNNSEPTFISAYVSNFVHNTDDKYSHLFYNILIYAIVSIGFVIIWILRELGEIPIPRCFFLNTFIIAYLIMPFVFSGLTYSIFINNKDSCGFSGIVFFMLGVLLLIVFTMLKHIINEPIIQKLIISIEITVVLIILVIIFFSGFYNVSTGISNENFIVHSCGFIFGYIIAYLVEKYLMSKSIKNK